MGHRSIAAGALCSLLLTTAVRGQLGPDPMTASLARVDAKTPLGDRRFIGVWIAPNQLLVGADEIDSATSAVAMLNTCQTYDVLGILAYDEQSGLAILSVPTNAQPVRTVDAALATPPVGTNVHVDIVMPIEGCWGASARSKPLEILANREWAGEGVRLRIDLPLRLIFPGCPVYDDAGHLCAILGPGAGNDKRFAIPVTTDTLPPIHEVVPLAAHAARDPSQRAGVQRLYDAGASLVSEHRHEEAIARFEQAIAIEPAHWRSLWQLGCCRDQTGHPEDAFAPLRQATEIEPEFCESWYSLGLVLLKLRRDHEAIEPFRRAIALEPDYAAAHGMLAVVLVRDGDIDGAVAESEEAIRLKPESPQFYQNLAIFLDDAGRSGDAVNVWRLLRRQSA